MSLRLLESGSNRLLEDGTNRPLLEVADTITGTAALAGAGSVAATGSHTAFASSALTATTFRSVLAAMQLIKNVDGEPMGFDDGSALRLIVPPQLSAVASGIVEAPFLTGGATNVNAGLAKVLVLPQLGGDATSWYLAQTEGQTKPLLWQLRQSPILASLVNINDPNVFELDVFRWGLKARGVAGYGMPWLMAKCKA